MRDSPSPCMGFFHKEKKDICSALHFLALRAIRGRRKKRPKFWKCNKHQKYRCIFVAPRRPHMSFGPLRKKGAHDSLGEACLFVKAAHSHAANKNGHRGGEGKGH